MRDGRPSNLKDMLREAKDTSELMVDLAYAALFYNSEDISEEVFRLEERLNVLVFDMRTMAILAARSPADSEQMAGILQVVQDIEKIGNAANDIAKIVVKRLGIPRELLQDIPDAEETPTRVRTHAGSRPEGRRVPAEAAPTGARDPPPRGPHPRREPARRPEPVRRGPRDGDGHAAHRRPLGRRVELRPGARGRAQGRRRALHAGSPGGCGRGQGDGGCRGDGAHAFSRADRRAHGARAGGGHPYRDEEPLGRRPRARPLSAHPPRRAPPQ